MAKKEYAEEDDESVHLKKFCFLQQHGPRRDVGVPQKMQEEDLYKLLCQGTNRSKKKKKKNERMSLNQ